LDRGSTLLPSSLAFATKLETLALGLSEIEDRDIPEAYAAFTALRTLSFSHLAGITDTLPSSWGNAMTNLETQNYRTNTIELG
jgi:hypothetical protein